MDQILIKTFITILIFSDLMKTTFGLSSAKLSIKTASKEGQACVLRSTSENNSNSSIEIHLTKFESMSQIHQDCNYAQQLLECIGNVCKCNKKTSKKINSGRCLFKNGEMCFTNRVCASGICGAECKCSDVDILNVYASSSRKHSIGLLVFLGFLKLLLIVY